MIATAISQVGLISTGIPKIVKSFIEPRNSLKMSLKIKTLVAQSVTLYSYAKFGRTLRYKLRE